MTAAGPPGGVGAVRRPYRSDTRAEAAARTRDAILAAFAQQLGRAGQTVVSVPEAAAVAGVSIRTVYHHFPDDDARRRALASWIDARLAGDEPFGRPASIDDLVALTRRLYGAAARHPELVRAQAGNGFDDPVRRERLRERRADIARVVAALGAPPDVTRRTTALVQLLMSAEAGLPLVDVHGLSFAAAADAACEAIVAVLERVRCEHGDHGTKRVRPSGRGT